MEKISYKLPVFEGPLDLLLHLISKNKLNIQDIAVSDLLEQYLAHIAAMQEADMDVASEFLEMAARLVHMKTVSLLPKHEESEQLKKELTGQLLEYQTAKEIAALLAARTEGFDLFCREPSPLPADKTYRCTHQPKELLCAYLDAAEKGKRRLPPPQAAFTPIVAKPIVSVTSRIVFVLRRLWGKKTVPMRGLLAQAQSRSELVATFLAVLELVRGKRVEVSDGVRMEDLTLTAKERTKWK